MGWCDDNTTSDGKGCWTGRAGRGLFDELVRECGGMCTTEGTLDQCGDGVVALCMSEELGGGKKTHSVLDAVAP